MRLTFPAVLLLAVGCETVRLVNSGAAGCESWLGTAASPEPASSCPCDWLFGLWYESRRGRESTEMAFGRYDGRGGSRFCVSSEGEYRESCVRRGCFFLRHICVGCRMGSGDEVWSTTSEGWGGEGIVGVAMMKSKGLGYTRAVERREGQSKLKTR